MAVAGKNGKVIIGESGNQKVQGRLPPAKNIPSRLSIPKAN